MDVQTVLTKLLSFRNETVEPAIGHVASGVGNLNEEQVEKAVELIRNIATDAIALRDESLALLTPSAPVVETPVSKKKRDTEVSVEV